MAGQIERGFDAGSRSGSIASGLGSPPGFAMSSTGTRISRSSALRLPASTTAQSLLRADEEAGDPLQRTLRRGQADALRVIPALVAHEVAQPLQCQRQVGPALRGGDGVDLVDDDRLDAAEDLAGPRGHHQVEGLRGRDEDVGRLSQHRLPLALRRVAGAKADADFRPSNAPQGGPEVPLDVVGEGLQRRDVRDPHARPEPLGLAGELVDPPQERRERLARAGRRADERVLAAGDPRPSLCLGGRGSLE